MQLPRFSLGFLLAVTAVAAIGFAGLSRPSPLWLSAWTTATLVAAGWGVWRIVGQDDSRRAFWAGALLLGGLHALWIFGPTFSVGHAPNSLATLAIDEVLARVWSDGAGRYPYQGYSIPMFYSQPGVPTGADYPSPPTFGRVVPPRAGIAHWMLTWALAAWGGWFALCCRERDAREPNSEQATPPRWTSWTLAITGLTLLALVWGAIFAQVAWAPALWLVAGLITVAWMIWAHAALIVWFDRSRRRIWLGGAVVAGGLWLAIVFGPGWSSGLGDHLPHAPLAWHVQQRIQQNQNLNAVALFDYGSGTTIISGTTVWNTGGNPYQLGSTGVVPNISILTSPVYPSFLVLGSPEKPGVDGSSIACGCFAALLGAWLAVRAAREEPAAQPHWAWRVAPWLGLLFAATFWRQGWIVTAAATWLLCAWTSAIVGARYGSAERRRERLAAAVAMGVWTTIAFAPWFSQHVRPMLLPTHAFNAIDQALLHDGAGQSTPLPTFWSALFDQMPYVGTFLVNDAWPAVVFWLGLGARYPLATPGHILLALPIAWIAEVLARRSKNSEPLASLAGHSPSAAAP